MDQFFYIPLLIAEYIEKRIGKGKKGIIVYVIIHLFFSPFLSIITNGFDLWILRELIPSIISDYFLLGMLYVFFFKWRK